MKRLILVVLTGAAISGLSWGQTLTGTYTIAGSSPNYVTISAAITAINGASTITGKVTFFIQGDIATEPGGTITSALLNSSDRIVFRPSGSTRSVFLDAPIIINSSYVTIDGSITEGGTSQNMKFGLNTGGDGTYLVGITGFVSNDSVKHCELGVSIGSAGDYAVKVDGINTKSSLVLDSLTVGGSGKTNGIIYLHNLAGTNVISNCTINGTASSNAGAAGIRIGTANGTLNILKTKIHALSTSGGGGLFGIDNTSASLAALNLFNNMIGGDFSASSSPSSYVLVNLNGGGAKKAYHNTLVLSSISGLGSNTGACVALIGGTLDLENNILVNHVSAGFASCIFFGTDPSAITSNYNCLYKSGTGNIGDDGLATYPTLGGAGGWQTGTSKDPNSVSFAPFLVSSNNLHLQSPYVFGGDGDERLTGTNLTATVADDIDGNTRRTGVQSGGTGQKGPYMGADESTSELPIQLTAINVTSSRLDATLKWSTATEVNNHGFEIERRSVQGSGFKVQGLETLNMEPGTWNKVAFIRGSGTSSSPKEYSYVDPNLPAGRYAYRIKQIDNDGSFTYYLAAEVEVGVTEKVLALESNYPNPFNPSTNIAFSVPENGKVALKVFNILGQEVAVLFDGIAEAGKLYQQTFNASQFPTGLYFSRLEFGGKSLMRKMLFVK